MIIYYTYTVISTVLTIFNNFSYSFHDNVLRQGKTPPECLYRWKNTPYRKILFFCNNENMSINFLSIFSELNCFAYVQIHVRVVYLFLNCIVASKVIANMPFSFLLSANYSNSFRTSSIVMA